MDLTVGIATSGRPGLTSALVRRLAQQSRPPEQVIVCPAKPDDIEAGLGVGLPFPVRIVHGSVGLTAQRNAILRSAETADVVLFFDDDFIPCDNFIERCVEVFETNPDVMVVTGALIADGINSRGLTPEDAESLIAQDSPPRRGELHDTYGGYGCNMGLRMAPVRTHALTFDEELPLYGWLEDIDFSRHLAVFGRIVRSNLCRGVHLGVKKGRTSGVRLGYSQFANPIHMLRKKSMTARYAGSAMARNLLANFVKSLVPEPWIDRRGRLKGNFLALFDLVRGDLHPRNIFRLD